MRSKATLRRRDLFSSSFSNSILTTRKQKKNWRNCRSRSGVLAWVGTAKKKPAHRIRGGPVNLKSSCQSPKLESKLQAELHQTRVVHGGIHRAKPRRVDIGHRRTELRVVKEVEELRPEIQAHAFPRQRELFDNRKISVDETATGDRNAIRVS